MTTAPLVPRSSAPPPAALRVQFPECSTYVLPHCTIYGFQGCERIGTPLVALTPTTSSRVTTQKTFSFTYGRAEVGDLAMTCHVRIISENNSE